MIGVIGGSGFYELAKNIVRKKVPTPYGSVFAHIAKIGGKEVAFIPRHGEKHEIPPHKVNYRANVWALEELGASCAFTTYASGVISKYKPGDLIILDDIISFFTHETFFDSFEDNIHHTDVSEPFNKKLQGYVLEGAAVHGIKLKKGGIIATTMGPRYETPAEIRALRRLGANLVCMTAGHEVPLFAEAEIPLVSMAVGTNLAAGLSGKKLSHQEVVDMMIKKTNEIKLILKEFVNFVD
ncbi:MAG: MTAP family purine nucleoside phosphorylase [Candidatus Anstonellales archaeon]